MSENDQDKPTIVNVTSHNQSGGITAHTVHQYTPQARHIADPQMEGLRAYIVGSMPKKPTSVMAPMGDYEAAQFATEIQSFMESVGIPIINAGGSIAYAMFIPAPKGLNLQDKGDRQEFIVGANVS